MLVMQGLLPPETAKEYSLSQSDLIVPFIRQISFLNEGLTDRGRLERLKTYYKFIMIRNPLERLLSAYRNKIEPALTNATTVVNKIQYVEGETYFDNHKHFILSRYRPLDILQQKTKSMQVSFSDFVQWILDTQEYILNEHFAMQITNSQPCMVKYDFHANFKNFSTDVRLLIEKLNTHTDYFTDHDSHKPTEQTRLFLGRYYSQLSHELKYRLFQRMFVELDFYYHLFPEEQWSHTEILDISEPVLTALL